MVINRMSLMSRLKIKYPPVLPLKSYAASEYIAPGKPSDKNSFHRFRYTEWLTVHFFLFKNKMRRYAASNFMRRGYCPYPFSLISFSPAQRSAGTKQGHKRL